MGPIDNSEPDKLRARASFARRLRALRAAQGFATARSLAKALAIDENRYTRYERAEVEPDLALLSQICLALRTTPDVLLGFGVEDAAGTSGDVVPAEPGRQQATGFAEIGTAGAGSALASSPAGQVQTAAWNLATTVVALRGPREPERPAGSDPAEPMALLRATVAMQRDLLAQPYAAIARIASDPALAGLGAADALRINDLVRRLTEALGRAAD